MFKFKRLIAAVALAAFYGLTAPAFAQQTESRIVGQLMDEQMGAMPGVTITVTSAQTGAVRTEVTQADGSYVVVTP